MTLKDPFPVEPKDRILFSKSGCEGPLKTAEDKAKQSVKESFSKD